MDIAQMNRVDELVESLRCEYAADVEKMAHNVVELVAEYPEMLPEDAVIDEIDECRWWTYDGLVMLLSPCEESENAWSMMLYDVLAAVERLSVVV